MRAARTLMIAVVLTVVLSGGAFAVVDCGNPGTHLGGGLIEVTITTDQNRILNARVLQLENVEYPDHSTCGPPPFSTCTWTAQGTPGASNLLVVAFDDGDDMETICVYSSVDGLPVELIEFSVE